MHVYEVYMYTCECACALGCSSGMNIILCICSVMLLVTRIVVNSLLRLCLLLFYRDTYLTFDFAVRRIGIPTFNISMLKSNTFHCGES